MFPSRSIADLARHLAQHAEAVCRYYLSERPQARPLLARRRRRQCARPLALCPPLRTGHRQGRRRQMDRRRHGRPWRSARSHPAESAPRRCPRGRRRGPSISQPAGTACRPSKQRAGRADRWRQTPCGTTAMGHDAADRRHPRRRLPRRTRHHRPRRHARKPCVSTRPATTAATTARAASFQP